MRHFIQASRIGVASIMTQRCVAFLALVLAASMAWAEAPRVWSNSLGMRFVRLPAGAFVMGSPNDEETHGADEPQREVRLSRPFWIGQHETTVGQYTRFVLATHDRPTQEKERQPGFGFLADQGIIEQDPRFNWSEVGFKRTDQHPVFNVSWAEANAFAAWLGQEDGKKYRLPTEAEWEYACRAGSSTRFATGDSEESLRSTANLADAAFLAKYGNATWSIEWNDGFPFTAPVGSFLPNRWGLHDMHGNVWEWCSDWYAAAPDPAAVVDPIGPANGERRVLRGGSFTNRNRYVRSADRNSFRPKYRHNFTGFRLVFTADGE